MANFGKYKDKIILKEETFTTDSGGGLETSGGPVTTEMFAMIRPVRGERRASLGRIAEFNPVEVELRYVSDGLENAGFSTNRITSRMYFTMDDEDYTIHAPMQVDRRQSIWQMIAYIKR